MWYTYLIQCQKGLYCGITTDIKRRELEHNDPVKQAKAIRRLGTPAVMVYCEEHPDRSEASKREYSIKQLTKNKKLELIKSESNYILFV
jgi:putative endonuclease